MGWDFQYPGNKTPLQIIKEDYPGFEFLATNRKGNVIYAALRHKGKPEVVFAGIFLLQTRDGMVGIKAMSEDDGPYYYGASKKVLNALTEASTEWALAWRDKCRKELAKPKIKLEVGMVVHFDPPIKFTNGAEVSTLQVKDPRRRTFTEVNGYALYKIDPYTLKQAIGDGRLTLA